MNASVPFLDALAPEYWPTFALVSARVAGVVIVAPVWSMRGVPRTIRGAFAILLTVALLPTVSPATLPEHLLGLPILLGSELILGVVIGLSAALFVYAAQVAAEVIAVQMGLSIAGILAPTASGSPPGIAELQHLMALAV